MMKIILLQYCEEIMVFSINGAESIRYTRLGKEYYGQKTILDPMRFLNSRSKTIKVLENNMRIVETRSS